MPGFDGKGPVGEGTMTGYGRGYCIRTLERGDNFPPNFASRRAWSRFRSYQGLGQGPCGRRFGRGRGFGLTLRREFALGDDKAEGNLE
ncbi:MAG: DUF5320 domain-containing protein [Clostridiales bacterium]|jgi:hypothetical protein|nr:DUF5320 domain-containing protein [Clostridiales bacterium]